MKKLSCTLGAERGVALEVEAEFVKTMKANKQLIADCERTDARYASASASAATNSQNVGKLQKKVESQQLQIAQYRSCEVVVGDGVAQPGATQAEMASLAVQVERLGSVMLTKADLTKVTQDLCDEVAERQKGVSARHNANFLALMKQENAALADPDRQGGGCGERNELMHLSAEGSPRARRSRDGDCN
jgi:hypothetical protein